MNIRTENAFIINRKQLLNVKSWGEDKNLCQRCWVI